MKAPFAFIRYFRHAKRLFGGQGKLASSAYRIEIVRPEEKVSYLPAIYLAGQLDRVTNSGPNSTKDREIDVATRLSGIHSPTIAYHLKDVALVDGSIYGGRLKLFVTRATGDRSTHSGDMDTAALVTSYYGARYFGHWLRDDCTAYVLAKQMGLPPVSLPSPSGPHVSAYSSLFQQDWTPITRGRFRHLTIFHDYHENSLKRERYKTLRYYAAAKFPVGNRRSLIYLKRGAHGATRVVQNEDAIIDALLRNGFTVVDTGSEHLDMILDVMVNAKVVVSVEGSHIAHCVYSVPQDCGLLVLQPPDRFSANHRLWSNCLGIRFGFVVGSIGAAGYQFDTEEILQTVDLMVNAKC